MLLPDANGLLYSHFVDSTLDHDEYAAWLTRMATGAEPFALTVMVLAGFVRIATNPECLTLRRPSIRASPSYRRFWNSVTRASSDPALNTTLSSRGCAVTLRQLGNWFQIPNMRLSPSNMAA